MRAIPVTLAILLALGAQGALAAKGKVGLASPAEIAETGFWAYVLPRFSLKTGVAVRLAPSSEADIAVVTEPAKGALALMRARDVRYFITKGRGKAALRFHDWLISAIGQRTINGFRQNGQQVFTAATRVKKAASVDLPKGDVLAGEELAFRQCGRCHVVGPRNKYGGIGLTPSFGALRSIPDWRARFRRFWNQPPHRALTRIEGVTKPFSHASPATSAVMNLTMKDIEDIRTYVETINPKDLGAALQRN